MSNSQIKRSWLQILVLFVSLFVCGCKKDAGDGVSDNPPTTASDTYILGWEQTSNKIGIASINAIVIWKNGVKTLISNPTNDANSIAFAVSGSDVFVLGTETNPSTTKPTEYHYDLKLWKNGVVQAILERDFKGSQLGDIFITEQKDIYIAYPKYNVINKNYNIAIWKNGIESSLTNGTELNTFPTAIKVVGSDIHVIGVEIQRKGTSDPSYPTIAKYWKNGVATSLTSGANGSFVNSLFISGNDIYFGGYERASFTNYYDKNFFYYKNGIKTSFNINETCFYESMSFFGNNIYVCGQDASYFPSFWKNAQKTTFNLNGRGLCNSLYISGSDVIVVGSIPVGSDPYYQKAVFWKNGIMTTLSNVRSTAEEILIK